MLEEILFYLRENPEVATALGIVGALCLAALLAVLSSALRWRFAEGVSGRLAELSLVKRAGQWVGSNSHWIALGVGVLCLLAAVALTVKPVRLMIEGTRAGGIVSAVIEKEYQEPDGKTRIESTATIRFMAGDRDIEIRRTTSRERGSWCIAGCYSKGGKLTILYFADNPKGAEVETFFGLFTGTLVAGGIAGIAFLFAWVSRPRRIEGVP